MMKMSQKRQLFLLFRLASSYARTTVIKNYIDPESLGPLNLIFTNQFKWPPYNNT